MDKYKSRKEESRYGSQDMVKNGLYYSYDINCKNSMGSDTCEQTCAEPSCIEQSCTEQYCKSQSIQVQSTINKNKILKNNENIKFNDVIFNRGSSLKLDSITGNIKILSPGCYLINWWVCTEGSAYTCEVEFSIVNPKNKKIKSYAPTGSFQIVGQAIIEVTSTPYEVKLINSSDGIAQLSNTDIQANIMVLSI
ncbi:MAG: hypothetical protein ACRDD7_13335 [Peptostreptococcaceae bacterium]